MFEDNCAWYELSPSEIHAFGYGLIDGLKFWRRQPIIGYEQIDGLNVSPEWKADLKAKYHYYYVAYEAPEILSYLTILSYLAIYKTPELIGLVLSVAGVTL